jgi:GT2 family glycosyltransferase
MESGSTWVGELELERGEEVTPVMRPLAIADRTARIWVRRHGAPVGHVEVPVAEGSIDMGSVGRALAEQLTIRPNEEFVSGAPEHCGSAAWSDPSAQIPLEPVSVVVATKGRPTLVRQCLISLQALDYPSFEVLLVDGSLDIQTREVFEESVGADARFRYIAEPRPGLSLARNVGVSLATHELVAFTDDDCRVDRLWLRFLVRPFATDPKINCVTGMVPSADLRTPAQRYFDQRVWWSSQLKARVYTRRPEPGDSPLYPFHIGIYGTGANFAMRAMTVRDVGWFSELLGSGGHCRGGGDDQDMFVRVIRSGHKLAYDPQAIVWHEGRATDEELKAQLQEYGSGMPINGMKWLADSGMRRDVGRRIPRAITYYVRLVVGRGAAGASHGSGMALAELRGVPRGLWGFVKGYWRWLQEESGFDPRPARIRRILLGAHWEEQETSREIQASGPGGAP